MGRFGLLVSDFIISFMWVSSGVFLKKFVHNVLGFSHEPTADILKSALSIVNMFFFAFLAKLTKGGTYNPLTVFSDAITGDFSRFLFTVAARIPAQVIGSVAGVRFIMGIFSRIGLGPRLTVDIHQGALTEGLLTYAIVTISLGLSRNIPGSFFMKTWISSVSKLTLHILGSDLTGGCMNPASIHRADLLGTADSVPTYNSSSSFFNEDAIFEKLSSQSETSPIRNNMSLSVPALTVISVLLLSTLSQADDTVCIVGAGIGGASVAHFLREYSSSSAPNLTIRMFERNVVVGGRMATVNVSGEFFEAGASILHPKNFHAVNYTKLLNLTVKAPSSSDDDSDGFAIWDGEKFIFKTLSFKSKLPFVDRIVSLANSLLLFFRYGFSLVRMDRFVENIVNSFLKYYESSKTRPIFETVDAMLKWAGLYNLTTRTLAEELADAGLAPLLVQELVTVITRINYGQSVSMSGLAGAVSLAGSGGGLWSIKGGNWQMASGLIDRSNVALHLEEEIESISSIEDHYELNSTIGNSYICDVAVVATPLDELNIQFSPSVSIPKRVLQHTHATMVRGLLNPVYFSVNSVPELPDLIATLEDPNLPFTSISLLKQHAKNDITYKIFSRQPLSEALLDSIFSARKETIRRNWAAYPRYTAPEVFAPFILDGQHLYYVNAFENAASTMETSAVAAENVARLILSRYYSGVPVSLEILSSGPDGGGIHVDL